MGDTHKNVSLSSSAHWGSWNLYQILGDPVLLSGTKISLNLIFFKVQQYINNQNPKC